MAATQLLLIRKVSGSGARAAEPARGLNRFSAWKGDYGVMQTGRQSQSWLG